MLAGRPLSSQNNFYPRPPRGGRLKRSRFSLAGIVISIHALREEGDCVVVIIQWKNANFYPRPPRGGRRRQMCYNNDVENFYPRPPRGGRPPEPQDSGRASTISIHALREEGDSSCGARGGAVWVFLSTPSARRATVLKHPKTIKKKQFLSTPSARRATREILEDADDINYFYPRPPRGGRLLPVLAAQLV